MTGRKAHIYLDSETDALLDRLAETDRERTGFASRSEVVRRAVRELAEREIGPAVDHSPPKGRKRRKAKGGASA